MDSNDKDMSKRVAVTGASRVGKTVLWGIGPAPTITRFANGHRQYFSGEMRCGLAVAAALWRHRMPPMTDRAAALPVCNTDYHDYANQG